MNEVDALQPAATDTLIAVVWFGKFVGAANFRGGGKFARVTSLASGFFSMYSFFFLPEDGCSGSMQGVHIFQRQPHR